MRSRKLALHARCILLVICLFFHAVFYTLPLCQAGLLDKLLGQKYYLQRDIAFGTYLKLNATFPDETDAFSASRYYSTAGLKDLPYAWITPPAPKNLSLALAYCFKFAVYSNCSANTQGRYVASFWRWRSGVETRLYTCAPSSQSIAPTPTLQPVTWFEWINATLTIRKDDRLILRLQLYAYAAGRFWIGLDCAQYASYVQDPNTETLYISGDGTNYTYEFPSGSATPPPHYDKVDETSADNDTTFIETDDTTTGVKQNRFLYPDSSLAADTIINSVTVYVDARNNPNPPYPSYAGVNVEAYNTTINATYYVAGWTLTNSYAYYSNSWTTNPSTTRAWTVAQINAFEFGVRGQSQRVYKFGVYFYSVCRVTQSYIVIEYTPAGSWHNIETWTFSLLSGSWHNAQTWTISLLTGSWHNIETWVQTLLTRAWQNIEAWAFDVLTGNWQSVETWTLSAVTGAWQNIQTWSFDLLTGSWHSLETWTSTIQARSWQTISSWIFHIWDDIPVDNYAGPKDSSWGIWIQFPGIGGRSAVGQAFTPNATVKISRAEVYIVATARPNGTVVAALYEVNGTYGSTAVPTGSILAMSEQVHTEGFWTWKLATFWFNQSNQYSMTNGHHYAIVIETFNCSQIHGDPAGAYPMFDADMNGAHGGNMISYYNQWNYVDNYDVLFTVYGWTTVAAFWHNLATWAFSLVPAYDDAAALAFVVAAAFILLPSVIVVLVIWGRRRK